MKLCSLDPFMECTDCDDACKPVQKTNFEHLMQTMTVEQFVHLMKSNKCEYCPCFVWIGLCDYRKRSIYDPTCADYIRQWCNEIYKDGEQE